MLGISARLARFEMQQAGSDGSQITAASSPASVALARMAEKPE
jgi:hypothetical protein